jgi:DNA repair protein RecN (Recombination protein N)
LIFDEIDVGVGGRSAGVVGEKLWQLTGHHQVLCITHMPQVAAFADQHKRVEKRTSLDTTNVTVSNLASDDRAEELAAMLAGTGPGNAALASARELMDRATDLKKGSQPTIRSSKMRQ